MASMKRILAAAAAVLWVGLAQAQQPIRIGELNSYKGFPAFLEPYRKGWQLAMEEVNAAGGVAGRKIEVISRDDNGNHYPFRLRASTYMQTAMLIPEAARLKKKRWAIVYPNYEYGQSAADAFRKLLKARQPDVEFVAEQAPPLGKIDAGATVQALASAKPDAIFSALFGADLAKFVREGNTRGLFRGREVFNLLAGEPEYLDPLKDETPEGWTVTGYPWSEIASPEHKKFVEAYRKRWNDYPRLGSVVGYAALHSVAAALRKAGSTEPEKFIAAMRDLNIDTPFGKITYRALDHQSTMGAYVGKLAKRDGKGVMVDWVYRDGRSYLPSDDEVKKLRPTE